MNTATTTQPVQTIASFTGSPAKMTLPLLLLLLWLVLPCCVAVS